MCVICENFEVGDILPSMTHEGECPICNNRFSVLQEAPLWVCDTPHSKNGSLLHLTNDTYICKCGTELLMGFYCQGISGDGLFLRESESVEVESPGVWETIKLAFGITR